MFRLPVGEKVDADADDGMGLSVMAHGFYQDAAEFVHADNEVVGPFDLRGAGQGGERVPAGECGY